MASRTGTNREIGISAGNYNRISGIKFDDAQRDFVPDVVIVDPLAAVIGRPDRGWQKLAVVLKRVIAEIGAGDGADA